LRKADEDDVYAVEGFLSASFNKDIPNWRDKQVWEFNQQDIQRVDFLYPADSSYSIQRAGADQWTSNGDTLATRLVDNVMSRLANVRASGFVDDSSPDNFGQEQFAIQIQLANGMQHTLRLRPDADQDNRYRAVASDYPYVFTLNKNSWNNSVLRSRDQLRNP
jgi:hypothetical protein